MSLVGQGPSARGTPSGSARHTLCLSNESPAAQRPRLHPDWQSPSFGLDFHPPPSLSLTVLADLSIF